MSTTQVSGIHHVTAIAGDAQENVDFYAGLLGMRLVKRSVNQDDPATYHLFYADAEGHPGSDLTFFPYPQGRRARRGAGVTNEVVLGVPPGSLGWWKERLDAAGVRSERSDRFGEPTLAFRDPHGLHLALSESQRLLERPFAAWDKSSVPPEHQVRGIHAVRLLVHEAEPTVDVATGALGMRFAGHDGEWARYEGKDPASGYLEVRAQPDAPRASGGIGSVHHVAWRVADDAEEAEVRAQVTEAGLDPTPVIDRFWFKSVYFREPGGILFELATDGPGFGVDEDILTLGESLVLPPWLEAARPQIERALAPLSLPHLEKERVAPAAAR
ncbi:MAG TPA: ring-cleaving dioxygenase [Candidatus Thermoplasmatota archaeon]|nr:ring-cleaving dioxygenase [Candidatus Thermoplasmatota archaeon]